MEDLIISQKSENYYIPQVHFYTSGICEIKGESYLEDTFEFYDKIKEWFVQFTLRIKNPITLNIKLSYFNTASSKALLDIFKILKDYEESSGKVTVNWYVPEWDDNLKMEIEDFTIDSGLPITIFTEEQIES